MKTTLDLPDELIRAVKLKAVRDGRKLKDAIAELLRMGLAATGTRPAARGLRKRKIKGPIIRCRHAARDSTEMTPERVAQLLIEQEAAWHDEAR